MERQDGQIGSRVSTNVIGLTFRREREVDAHAPLRKACVLLVEDSAAAADATGLLLRAAGTRVRWADSIASAERHMRSFAPDTVIIDPGLPDGSGLDLLARLAALGPSRPRLIVISGDELAEQAALDAGADRFLLKPVAAAALLREVVTCDLTEPLRVPGPEETTPALLMDLQRARLDLLRAALSGQEADLAYPMQFLGVLARGGDLPDLQRAVERVHDGLDGPRDLAAALARMIDRHAARLPGTAMSGPTGGGAA